MRSRLLFIFPLLLAMSACDSGRTALASTSSTPSAAATQPGILIAATPIRFVIPAGLATGASAEDIDVVTDQTGAPWDVAPPHLQLTFAGYSLQSTYHVPQLFLYPAQQYSTANPRAAESLKRLQTVLASPSASYTNDTLPQIPFINAGQVLAVQQKVLHFSGGTGVRFVTQYGQDVSPINNNGLFYHFQGLTADGQYYIVAILPVNLPFLAPDNNPDSKVPAGGIPFPPSSASGSDFADYYKQVAQRIDGASTDQFSPTLDVLDQMMQSLTIYQ
jgi:hypothetical protein